MVKAQENAKNEETKSAEKKHSAVKPVLYKLLAIVIIGGIGYGLWKNPAAVDKLKALWSSFTTAEEQESPIEAQLRTLNIQVRNLQNELAVLREKPENQDIASFNEKFAAMEKTNLNIIDSKADVATVLGLLTRMDKAESKLDNMVKITDEGALILTATMLVKDSAERGGDFEYEVGVLQQIAENNLRMKEPIATLAKYAANGIETRSQLTGEFKNIYKQLLIEQKEAFNQTWKDRLNSKLNEIIKVKNTKEATAEFEANQELVQIKKLVESGYLDKAVQELKLPSNQEFLNNAKLKEWLDKAEARVEFNKAVNKITASSLAMMKVNFIKKETKND